MPGNSCEHWHGELCTEFSSLMRQSSDKRLPLCIRRANLQMSGQRKKFGAKKQTPLNLSSTAPDNIFSATL